MSGGAGAGILARKICAITDPFCNAAIGAKYPDATSQKTLAWTTESLYSLTTDSSGRACLFFGPDPSSGAVAVSTWTGATNTPASTVAGVAYPGWSQWNALGSNTQWRCVSIGVEVRSTLSMMNNQGSIGVAVIPNTSLQVDATQCNLDAIGNFSVNHRISANEAKPLNGVAFSDGVISKQFKYGTAAPPSVVGSYGTDVMAVYMVGGPATMTSIQIRLIAHYELSFGAGTVFNSIATPSAVENATITTGSNFVKRTMDQVIAGGAKEVERRVHNTAMAFGKYAAASAMGALGTYLGGPALGAIASGGTHMMLGDVD